MANYLKIFELMAQYEEYINSDSVLLPNVSLIEDTDTVQYNPVPNYLKFTAEEDNSTISLNAATSPDIKYSLNGGDWKQWDYTAITLNTGDTVRMKGNNSNGFSTIRNSCNQFQMTGKIGASGNIMSLLYDDDFEGKLTIPCENCFYRMFENCAALTTVPELPATTLAAYCYYGMFDGCTSLTTAPELPATTLAEYCYGVMFHYCISLITPPELPATTLATGCYYSMFSYCYVLSITPELPAKTLANYCYFSMFRYCTSLTTAPVLPATTLAGYCYQYMFQGCTSLTTAPVLPATTLAGYCYQYMFQGCTSLTTAPNLPATTLEAFCYYYMFNGCTSLTTVPELPATILKRYCYCGMFSVCTSLTTAPELPATVLADNCYYEMFRSCSSLITSPELPATTLTYECYSNMFRGCSKLNYIKMLATNITGYDYLSDWVNGVASEGIFVKHPNMTSLPSGSSGIPKGWTVKDAYNYLKFTAEENNSTIKLNSATNPDIKYSLNGGEWTQWDYNAITLNTGDTVRMKGNNSNGFSFNDGDYNYFEMTGTIGASGNIMSLLYEDDFEGKLTIPCDYCFCYMFDYCSSLTTAPELPATTLANNCYTGMFEDCSALTNTPALPATTLARGCYGGMFDGCSALSTAPKLPAKTLASYCYGNMFSGCTALKNTPKLPAKTLAEDCYSGMFYGCTALTTAPELPATTLAADCYKYMFYGCTSLKSITCLATDISATDCTHSWVDGVSSIGTFTKSTSMTGWTNGVNGIPNGWTVEDMQESQHLIIYVDDFPFEKIQDGGETVEEAMHRQIYASDECAIGNKYEYTGQKITYNDNQYYLWEMTEPCEFSPQVKYLMTTTTNVNTLFGESLEDDLQNKFVSFVGMLNADKEVTYINTDIQGTENELYLVKVVGPSVQRLRIWVDDFPLEVQQAYNEAHQNLLQMTLANPDSNSNKYVYTNTTIEMNGNTYYVWEHVLDDTTDNTAEYYYLLTTTNDIDTLYSQSLEDNFNNEFVSFAGRCSSDLNDIYVENRITGKMCLVKVTLENGTPVIYVDDFAASLKEYEVSNQDGANPYIYNGNTITYDGNTYYLWKAEAEYSNNNENTRYFATSTIDFDELYAQSLEDNINNTFTSAIGMFSDNEEIYNAQAVREDGTDEHYLVKIEKI